MKEEEKVLNKYEQLAETILGMARDGIMVNFRYLDSALYYMPMQPLPGYHAIGMNGTYIAYDAMHVLQCYRYEQSSVARIYMHMVLHCIFYHPFNYDNMQRGWWDLAADMAVESAILELGLKTLETERDGKQADILKKISNGAGAVTAERVYRYFVDNPLNDVEMREYTALFGRDDHQFWGSDPDKDQPDDGEGNQTPPDIDEKMLQNESEEDWRKISERVRTDLETFSKKYGDKAGNLTQNLRECNRERYDYAGFLKRFAVLGEVMQINDDEFDYIFYTYGLKLYENMPLIEPLEYKDVKRIREFVIAIDTSGSVEGEKVQLFIEKTYNILKQTESFFTKINLHIVQCDAEVQEDRKISSQEDFDEYMATMTLHGFGGTNFCPVFDYVEQLRENREFTNLKGLIYFTDGYGKYPQKKPDYDVAFVFLNEFSDDVEVPPWAIKLVLTSDDI